MASNVDSSQPIGNIPRKNFIIIFHKQNLIEMTSDSEFSDPFSIAVSEKTLLEQEQEQQLITAQKAAAALAKANTSGKSKKAVPDSVEQIQPLVPASAIALQKEKWRKLFFNMRVKLKPHDIAVSSPS